jgi:hypothetical protein
MANTEGGEKQSCCSGCDCKGKAIKILALLLVGGVVGYVAGVKCPRMQMCPMNSTPISTPAPTPQK